MYLLMFVFCYVTFSPSCLCVCFFFPLCCFAFLSFYIEMYHVRLLCAFVYTFVLSVGFVLKNNTFFLSRISTM